MTPKKVVAVKKDADIYTPKVTSVAAEAMALTIAGPEDFEKSTALMEGIKGLTNEITAWIAPIKKKAQEMHKTIRAQEKLLLDPLDAAKAKLKTARLEYTAKFETAESPKISKRTYWSAEVTDIKALVAGVATGKYPAEMLTGNMAVLNSYAEALKDAGQIDGVKFNKREVEAF